jgi:hypothetical protein
VLTSAQLAQLKTELQNDPNVYGYAALTSTSAWQAIANALNLRRDGTNGGPAISVKRTDVAVSEIYTAIQVSDYTALPGSPTAAQLSTERRYLAWLTGLVALDRVRLTNENDSDAPITTNLKAMFASGTGTWQRLAALATRSASRAEQLFGRAVAVTDTDVETAWRLS